MFTDEGLKEYKKHEKYISDEEFDFSPDFVPTKETPKETVKYYIDFYKELFPWIDFDSPDFKWPVGIGANI